MKKLKILSARGYYGIDQNGIKELDLIELDVSYNEKINDTSFIFSLSLTSNSIKSNCLIPF